MITDKRLADLQSALTKSGSTHDIDDVLTNVMSGHAQLWETDTATVVTQIVQHPNYRSFNVWLAGGDLTGVLSLLEEGEEYAKANGCSTMEVTGRRGWKRILAPHGFHEEAVVLHKEL